jgi:lipopolysaccharide/colanic/teichoic acid biosynthesis glycosyltransferase
MLHAGTPSYTQVKRVMDVVLAALLLILLSPLFVLIGLAILMDSPGPILHRQERIGAFGKPFCMLKFRSMCATAEAVPHREYVVAYIQGAASRQVAGGRALYKLAHDQRVTTVGARLRRTSLDELPQLWNVLRGEMSLVGPRPPLAYEVAEYRAEHLRRLEAVPGMTGYWQVRGRGQTTFEEMVALDCEYIRRRSLLLDLHILISTIPAVLFGHDSR